MAEKLTNEDLAGTPPGGEYAHRLVVDIRDDATRTEVLERLKPLQLWGRLDYAGALRVVSVDDEQEDLEVILRIRTAPARVDDVADEVVEALRRIPEAEVQNIFFSDSCPEPFDDNDEPWEVVR
jgi:hypothetical protein